MDDQTVFNTELMRQHILVAVSILAAIGVKGIRSQKGGARSARDTSAQATTLQLDSLHIAVFDKAHSQVEEFWFTLGTSSEDEL